MSAFDATNLRLQKITARLPHIPIHLMRLLRMTYHIQKNMRDSATVALKPYGLVDASYMVLAALYGSDDETSTVSALGAASHEKPGNLTRLCDDLEARGLITRGARPGDRRTVMIALTDAGRALIEQAMPVIAHQTTLAYAGFSSAELQQLEQLLARQLQNMDRLATNQ